jgi:ATP-binding protein involved in chromosome partitioning
VPVSREQVLKALEGVIDPELKRSVVELDMVRDVGIDGSEVAVTIALTVPGCPLRASFEEQVAEALRPVEGISSVTLDFDVLTPEERQALTTKLRGDVAERSPGISVASSTRVIAVASGKGGVGKSSLTANLAAAFSRLGHRTGVLDADVYGYSIPTMLGPMLHRALEQFLSDVHWGELDTLVVDMPPGTGDVAISLGQLLPRAEAVVVTTPHRAAQQVAVRAAHMARKTNMRLLGVVENMSFRAGTGEELFGSGGGDELAREVETALLGRIPFDPRLATYADEGEAIVSVEPDAEVSAAILALAESIAATKREQGVGIVKSLPLVSA